MVQVNRHPLLMALLIAACLAAMPGAASALSVPTSPVTGQITEINAYAVGNPVGIQGFAGYTFPNMTNVLPQAMIAVIHSPGNSSVTIYMGGTPIVINQLFNWTLRYYFVGKTGVQPLNFTISSQLLGKTRQITYLVNVMTVTQYIDYLNQHSQQGYYLTNGTLYGIVGIAIAVVLASALCSIPLADGLKRRHQRKKGVYEEV